jgi:hypothetical protein
VKEYQDLKEEMDQLVGRINGRFTTYSWSPIRYIYGCVSQDELAGFYRDSAVALVTPLRDGMTALILLLQQFLVLQSGSHYITYRMFWLVCLDGTELCRSCPSGLKLSLNVPCSGTLQ